MSLHPLNHSPLPIISTLERLQSETAEIFTPGYINPQTVFSGTEKHRLPRCRRWGSPVPNPSFPGAGGEHRSEGNLRGEAQ